MAQDIVQEMVLDTPELHRGIHPDECKQHELILVGRGVLSIMTMWAAKQEITALENGSPLMKVRHRRA